MDVKRAFGLPASGDGLPPGVPRGRQAELTMWGEILQDFRTFIQTHTVASARLAGRIVNDVLEVGSCVFDVGASKDFSFHVAAGCVVVDNYSQHDVIVATGGRTGNNTAPLPTVGVTRVKAGTLRPVNLGAREFTIYGTALDEISYQVFTAATIPTAALAAVNGGGA